MTAGTQGMKLLEVSDLSVHLPTATGVPRPVDSVSFSLVRGYVIDIVGESGSGKTILARALLRLSPGWLGGGRILFEGTDLAGLPEAAMCRIRGNRIAMIFQDATTSLNPVLTIGTQTGEPLHLHRGLRGPAVQQAVVEPLGQVGIAAPQRRAGDSPHRLSGGMRQRAMIAMALICRPALQVTDEPTTALDVTIKAQILALLDTLRRTIGMAIILISLDLSVVPRSRTKSR